MVVFLICIGTSKHCVTLKLSYTHTLKYAVCIFLVNIPESVQYMTTHNALAYSFDVRFESVVFKIK